VIRTHWILPHVRINVHTLALGWAMAVRSASPLIPAIIPIIAKFIEKPYPINKQSRQSGKHQACVIEVDVFSENVMRSCFQNLHEAPRFVPFAQICRTRMKKRYRKTENLPRVS